ncbi:MAG: hypothetical protein ABJQ71_18890 [Roseibium sp.]
MEQFFADVPFFILAALCGFVPTVILVKVTGNPSEFSKAIIILLGLSLVGAAAGFTGGMSRTGVVGDIVPAVLALLGGVSLYLFGADTSRGIMTSIGASALSLSLLAAFALGASNRNDVDRYNLARDQCFSLLTNAVFLGNKKAVCNSRSTMMPICAGVIVNETFMLESDDINLSSSEKQKKREAIMERVDAEIQNLYVENCT